MYDDKIGNFKFVQVLDGWKATKSDGELIEEPCLEDLPNHKYKIC